MKNGARNKQIARILHDFKYETVKTIYNHCIYCGARAKVLDHVPPISQAHLYSGNFLKVPSCKSCNAFLSNKPILKLEDRKKYLTERYPVYYKKYLKTPEWKNCELKELKFMLKTYTKSCIRKRKQIENRINFLYNNETFKDYVEDYEDIIENYTHYKNFKNFKLSGQRGNIFMNQHEFLQNVFGDVSDKYILIWNLETKKSAWFNDIDRAAGLLKVLDSDTYIGVGLSDKDRGAHNRCRADEIVGLPGLVCDIDIAGEGHSEKAYPPTLEDALSIVKGHGIDPTLIIHSGHGIHCWWLFKEIWNFSNGDNHQAAQLSKRWGETLKQWAAEKGWTIDSVHDLSRILRPPNSWNCKNSRRVLTRTLEFDDARRYNPHDFETFFVEAGLTISENEIVAPTGTQRAAAENTATSCNVIQIDRASKDEFQKGGSGTGGAETENIVLNPMARAPQQKLFDLMEIDPKFKLTWQKKRTDFKDTSQSAYDMSIANICIQAGWSRQEIANAIIDHRTLHNSSPEKILREDYIERTINVAEKALKKNKIAEEANIVLEEAKEVCGEACIKNQEITDEQRNKYLESLGNKWGVKILRFEKHVSEDPSYILILDGYEPISFKKAEEIQDGRKFSATIAKVIDRLLPPLKVKDHIDQVNILLGCRIPIYTGYDCSRAGRIKSWVRQYINAHTKLARSEAIEYQKPYFDMDGHWYIFTKHMKGWLARAGIGNMSAEALNKDLTFIGAEEIEFKDTLSNGTRTTFRPKRIPHGVVI